MLLQFLPQKVCERHKISSHTFVIFSHIYIMTIGSDLRSTKALLDYLFLRFIDTFQEKITKNSQIFVESPFYFLLGYTCTPVQNHAMYGIHLFKSNITLYVSSYAISFVNLYYQIVTSIISQIDSCNSHM